MVINRQEGIQEGRKKECVTLLTHQMRRKLGVQPELEQVLQQLPGLSLDQLEELADSLLDFISLADLNEWMQKH